MFSLSNKIIILFILCLLILYFPHLEYSGIDISPDFFLIIVVLVSLKSSRINATLAGFFIGVTQDLLTQYLGLGFLSLLGSCFGYSVGNIKSIKKTIMKYILISISIFIYFFIFFLIKYSESYFFYLKFSLIKMIMTILPIFLLRIFFINFFKTIEK